jgi:hypothetical protein
MSLEGVADLQHLLGNVFRFRNKKNSATHSVAEL